jgi:wyosine [tRNA(Phe)-imidazoG37] synthetase (radical SAM superfamily)
MSTYVFGPVPSRRLGRSLGIDLIPLKTCTYDCLYCQLGKTTHKTAKRQEWVPLEEVLMELRAHLPSEPDTITISGSGEPTLH